MARRLAGCYVISLRPVGGHGAMRLAAARHGARVLALSPWRLALRDDADARAALALALQAPCVVVTSPAAARAASALAALSARPGQAWLAVGAGTARALRRAGIADVASPARMDSEGLLQLDALQDIAGRDVALVTAPGGRGTLAPALAARGARVLRADVYERVAIAPGARALAGLRELHGQATWLALSSGEALQQVLANLPDDAAAVLREARVVAASARLAELARSRGFAVGAVAGDARPASLLAAAAGAGALR